MLSFQLCGIAVPVFFIHVLIIALCFESVDAKFTADLAVVELGLGELRV